MNIQTLFLLFDFNLFIIKKIGLLDYINEPKHTKGSIHRKL